MVAIMFRYSTAKSHHTDEPIARLIVPQAPGAASGGLAYAAARAGVQIYVWQRSWRAAAGLALAFSPSN